MHVDPHFIAALLALVASEVIPIITKSKYGGIIHAITSVVGKLYAAPSDVAGLTARIEAMQVEIGKLRSNQVPSPPSEPEVKQPEP